VSEHAQRLQAAQAEAEAALEARDAQLAAMREREEANLAGSGAVPGVSLEELASMRERADEAENARIEAEEKARADAEALVGDVEARRWRSGKAQQRTLASWYQLDAARANAANAAAAAAKAASEGEAATASA
jgi:hypothetical protein